MNVELLKTALEKHWRFPSSRGPLSIEEVYSLPLTGNRGLNLDEIAIEVNAELEKKKVGKSFVTESENPEVATLDARLEILKDRIAELKLRASKNATEIAKATTKARLQELLAEKKNDELKNLSVEELEKKIEELS